MSSSPQPNLRSLAPGAQFGDYLVDSILGRGGMGVVYKAHHKKTGVAHALKVVMVDPFSSNRPRVLARFKREVEILASMERHPGVVTIYDCGTQAGIPWCIMEFVEGGPLSDRLRAGKMRVSETVGLLTRTARAVEHVHRNGIIHRDLKPGNVLLDNQGHPRVVDFGLAYDVLADRLTRTGELLGTPVFMAPEQLSRRSESDEGPVIGAQADVYGLGAIMYICLTGKPPFPGRDSLALLVDVMKTDPVPPRQHDPAIPPPLEAICLKAMEKSPEDRYATAKEMAEDLVRFVQGNTVSVSAPGRLARLARLRRRRSHTNQPFSRIGKIAIGAALLAAATASLTWWTGNPLTQPKLRERLGQLEMTVDDLGRLPPSADAIIDDLREHSSLKSDAELSRRVELLDLLRQSPIDKLRLAKLVRPGGQVDRRLLRRAERFIGSNGDMGTLGFLLQGVEPEAPASNKMAAPLARAIIEWTSRPADGGKPTDLALSLPQTTAAFEALYEARGLKTKEKGQLLLRRGSHLLLGAEPDHAAALADFRQALARHGIAADVATWPIAFVEFVRQELFRNVKTDLEAAWPISELVARTYEISDEISPKQVKEIQTESHIHLGVYSGSMGKVSSTDLERALVMAALLQRVGPSPVGKLEIDTIAPTLPLDQIVFQGESALKRHAIPQDMAALIMATRMLLSNAGRVRDRKKSEAMQQRALTWVTEARSHTMDFRWFHLHLSVLLEELKQQEPALEHAKSAWELDRTRPDEQRWPVIPERFARLFLETKKTGRQARDIDLAVDAAAASLAVRKAIKPRLSRMAKAKAPGAWKYSANRDVAHVLSLAAAALQSRGSKRCCQGTHRPTKMVNDALRLDRDPARTVARYELRARHHETHGRSTDALEDLETALAKHRRRSRAPDRQSRRLRILTTARLQHIRAALLEKLQRPEDASKARKAEQEALQAAKKLQPSRASQR